ncbi:synaptonemal complex protein 1 isoform X1 [Alligator mississippiensis]|uniref:synaptonemal complex protein 1 isoform X1 n=1 Tax=Alligator mississippiensis TaxID=8496 RepID=UPI002877FC59|nr:synaptonemal complex protein 1 isoform X1 [Alligator mississippiensis]
MGTEKPFKLFLPPRPGSGHVSAVRPQASARPASQLPGFNKRTEDDLGSPFVLPCTPSQNEGTHPGQTEQHPTSQKVKLWSRIEDENIETMNELYSKLYKEAEKIKCWKVTVESELKQKGRKLQENTKTIEAQRKAIQELQFENEKLSLKLEDEICENKDLLKENSATRHLCSLLKETCARYTEKSNKYEHERDETRQLCMELNNNIEGLILAFEELHVKAENSRLEMCFKLKEEAEKVEKLENKYKMDIHTKEKQVTVLTVQSGEKDTIISDIKIQLLESKDKITGLEETSKHQKEMLEESQTRQDHLMRELEEAKVYLQKAETTQKNLETDLQTAMETIIQVTGEKEAQMEELKATKALHTSVVDEFEIAIANLKELLEREQNRLRKLEDESEILASDLHKKSTELDEMAKLKCDKEAQLDDLTEALERSVKIQKDLKQQLTYEQSEKIKLIQEKEIGDSDLSEFKKQVEGLLAEKKHLETTFEKLQDENKQMNDTLKVREKKILDLEAQLSGAVENDQKYLKEIAALNAELEKEMLKNKQLNMDCNKSFLEKEQIAQEKRDVITELKKLQEDHKDNKKKEHQTEEIIKNLEETNSMLRKELESAKEKMKKKSEEIKNKLDENEENTRNIESEISRKEKQLKMLENKFNNLKKQLENKTKCNEELQQENKMLKKKIAAESKQSSMYEGKVKKLQLELENINCQYKETVDGYQKDLEAKKATEEKLLEEVEKLRLLADEAVTMQKESDIRCQHKIAEMVALMEKHKHQYDKMVQEKDTELKCFKTKEQEQTSTKKTLEHELSCVKSELASLKKQLQVEIEEKEKLAKEAKENVVPEKEKKHKKTQASLLEPPKSSLNLDSAHSKKTSTHNFTPANMNILENKEILSATPAKSLLGTPSLKTYTVKTPPKYKLQGEGPSPLLEGGLKKKRKVVLELDTQSDSSEHNDLLSMVAEEQMFKKLYKDYPQASRLHGMTPKKVSTPSTLKSPGSALKLAAIRKMREAGWTAVSKVDRKKKMKEAEKLFA